MEERDTSRTALGTAYLRAAHQLFDAPPRILEDPVAVPLLGAEAVRRLHERKQSLQAPGRLGLRSHVVLRSRFAEDRLEAAARRGASQYVILGAGFDTFALRQPEWAHALRIFEVDHAGTQATKQGLFEKAGLSMPANASFAAVDFEQESLESGLRRCGVDFTLPTFFSWLGVTMYLRRDAVDAVLRTIATFPPGGEVVLTFATAREDSPSPFERRAAGVGEPWVTYFTPEEMEGALRAHGFSEVAFLAPEAADALYFRRRPRDLPSPKRTSIVRAIV